MSTWREMCPLFLTFAKKKKDEQVSGQLQALLSIYNTLLWTWYTC